MIAAADRNRVTLMIAENVRYHPLYKKIHYLLGEGYVGEPALVQVSREAYLQESFLKERRWFLDARAAAGGIMMSGGIHDFEMLRMLIGEVRTVQAFEAKKRFAEMEGDDTSVATFKFDSGAVGVLVESFIMKSLVTASGPEIHTIRIDGILGSIGCTDGQTLRIFTEREDLLLAGTAAAHEIIVPRADTFELEARHFLHCIESGEEPITSGRSQRRTLEIVLAAYRSMQTGGTVEV
jgi:predicted dehydrogenase